MPLCVYCRFFFFSNSLVTVIFQAVQITKDILEVLVVLYGHNYQHNDIKLTNIRWSKEQQWCVLNACQMLVSFFTRF
jgi:hypothetical protein